MKDLSRATRRHHRTRLQSKKEQITRFSLYKDTSEETKGLCKLINTSQPCACPQCRNKRKLFKTPTQKEQLYSLSNELHLYREFNAGQQIHY